MGSKCREGGLVVCNANKCGRIVCWRWQQLLFTKYWQQQLQQQEQIAVVIAMAAEVYLAAMVSFGKISVRRRLGLCIIMGGQLTVFFSLPPDPCAPTGGLRRRFSITARRLVIDGSPGGLGVVLLEVVGAVAETGAVTAIDTIAAAEPLVGVEEPSSVDIPCTGEGRRE